MDNPRWNICTKSSCEIHTDFEKRFIRANVIHFDKFVEVDGYKVAKEKGQIRQEGKDYIVKDGDIIEFLFNVFKIIASWIINWSGKFNTKESVAQH